MMIISVFQTLCFLFLCCKHDIPAGPFSGLCIIEVKSIYCPKNDIKLSKNLV